MRRLKQDLFKLDTVYSYRVVHNWIAKYRHTLPDIYIGDNVLVLLARTSDRGLFQNRNHGFVLVRAKVQKRLGYSSTKLEYNTNDLERWSNQMGSERYCQQVEPYTKEGNEFNYIVKVSEV